VQRKEATVVVYNRDEYSETLKIKVLLKS